MFRKLSRFLFVLSTLHRVLSACCFLAIVAFTAHAQTLTFTTFAGSVGGSGSADGTGSAARFNFPSGVATDSGGNVYVADSGNNTIRKITPAGVVTTLAGLAGIQGSADGTGGAARFKGPAGMATDSGGNASHERLLGFTTRSWSSQATAMASSGSRATSPGRR